VLGGVYLFAWGVALALRDARPPESRSHAECMWPRVLTRPRRRATDRHRTGNGERRKTRTHSRMEIEPLEVWCTLDQRIIAHQICTRNHSRHAVTYKDAMKARLCVTVLLCAAAPSSYAARAHSLPHYLPLSF